MINFFSRILQPYSQQRESGQVALHFADNALHIVMLYYEQNRQKPKLDLCISLYHTDDKQRRLKELVRTHAMVNTSTAIVLDSTDYQLFPSDPPELPKEEWPAAMQWQIQDHISGPASEMVVELFDIPPVDNQQKTNRIYVVTAREARLQRLSHIALSSGLALNNITITELALCRLAAKLPEQRSGVGVLQLQPKGGLLLIMRQQTLYLARSINSSSQLNNATNNDFAHIFQEEVILEIQRTLDYFEGSFNHPPISCLYIIPAGDNMSNLPDMLAAQLAVPVKRFVISQHIDLPPTLSERGLATVMPAIGAALLNSPEWQEKG